MIAKFSDIGDFDAEEEPWKRKIAEMVRNFFIGVETSPRDQGVCKDQLSKMDRNPANVIISDYGLIRLARGVINSCERQHCQRKIGLLVHK